jgi:hypothetical protein
MKTLDHARFLAETAVEILWSDQDLFDHKINKDSLVKNLEQRFLIKLVETDTDILEEQEFRDCLVLSRN